MGLEPQPQRYGRYQLERLLAVGGMGEVFLHEAQLTAQLTHPHIAQVYDFGEVEGTWYLAMEHVPGPPLRTMIKRLARTGQTLPAGAALRIASQVAQGLDYAHHAVATDGTPFNLVHRDVSPSNLLLSTAGLAKVIDFGISKSSASVLRTQHGIVRGKLPYLAPEQALCEPADARTDIYALGLVLYEMLVGRRAIPGGTEVQILDAVVRQGFEPLESALRGRAPPIREVLGRALKPAPEDRFQTGAAFSEALEEALQADRLTATPARLGRGQSSMRSLPHPPTSPQAPTRRCAHDSRARSLYASAAWTGWVVPRFAHFAGDRAGVELAGGRAGLDSALRVETVAREGTR